MKMNSRLFWFVWIYVIVYVILTSVYLGVYVQNLSFTYTWFSKLGAPGTTLVSFRGSAADVLVRIATIFHVLSVSFIFLNMIAPTVFYLWYSLYALGAFFAFLSMVSMGTLYGNSNGQGQYGNVFNDPRYCCPIEIQSNAANGCPNPLPCTDPVVLLTELRPNDDPVGLFWFNFVLLLMQCTYLIVMIIWGRQEKKKEDEEEEEEEIPPPAVEEKKFPPVPVESVTQRVGVHRLRKTPLIK